MLLQRKRLASSETLEVDGDSEQSGGVRRARYRLEQSDSDSDDYDQEEDMQTPIVIELYSDSDSGSDGDDDSDDDSDSDSYDDYSSDDDHSDLRQAEQRKLQEKYLTPSSPPPPPQSTNLMPRHVEAKKRLASSWAAIIDKYAKLDEQNQGDLVDLETMEILEDMGHIQQLSSRAAVWESDGMSEDEERGDPIMLLGPERKKFKSSPVKTLRTSPLKIGRDEFVRSSPPRKGDWLI